jgi:pimeloyl-ACP methyl ester carboxylesterase
VRAGARCCLGAGRHLAAENGEPPLHLLSRRAFVFGATLLSSPRAARAFQRERVFDSAGVPIRFIEDGAGEAVILLHGYTSDAESEWVRTGLFMAAAERFRAIAMDARGHGGSGKPHDPRAYGPEMGLDAVRLMDHLGIARAHVVGYSMGAHIVAQLLLARPERFLSATLGGAAGRLGWTEADQRRVEMEAAEMDEGSLRSQIIRLWAPDQPPPTEEQIRARSAELLAGKDPRALAAVRRSNPAQVVALERLAATTVPVLGVVGGHDPYLSDFERLRAAMPSLRLVVVEGADHGEALNRPEFARAVLAFLQAQSGRGP